jgi:hypothetical protein
MAVISWRELPRTGIWSFGSIPELSRRFVLTVDKPGTTTPAQCAQAVNVDIGRPHPVYTRVTCVSLEISEHYEDSPYHIAVTAEYGPRDQSDDNPNPLLRKARWKFETFGQAVPALFYYGDDGLKYPLTNSAYDFFEGVTTDEAFQRVTIQSNIASFPSKLSAQVTNRINSDLYLFGNPYTWKCQGITAEERREFVNEEYFAYWEVTIVLLFRMSGWILQLPDMGFNYISGGQKRRVMTFDFENSEWIPSPVPMGLNGNGAQTFGAPAILPRRVYEVAPFFQIFGSPPVV